MGRARSAEPRDAQLLLRLTQAQMRALEAVAYLEGATGNTYAYDLLRNHLEVVAQDPLVATAIATREQYADRATTASPILRRAASTRTSSKPGTGAATTAEA